MDPTTDNEFLLGIKRGDEVTFGKMIDAYIPELTRYAYSILGDESAEDVVSIVLSKVWELRERISPVHGLRSYLYRAVRNRCINSLESNRSHKRAVNQHMLDVDTIDSGDSGNELDGSNIAPDLERRLIEGINHLSERQREAIRLRYNYDLTVPQIGIVLGITTKSAEKLVSRAMASIRESVRAGNEVGLAGHSKKI